MYVWNYLEFWKSGHMKTYLTWNLPSDLTTFFHLKKKIVLQLILPTLVCLVTYTRQSSTAVNVTFDFWFAQPFYLCKYITFYYVTLSRGQFFRISPKSKPLICIKGLHKKTLDEAKPMVGYNLPPLIEGYCIWRFQSLPYHWLFPWYT